MRKVVGWGVSFAGALGALVCFGDDARAQPRPAPPQKEQPQAWALQREQLGASAAADSARARARRGDCAGALASFDAAIRLSMDPTLRRDRGLCHEKLANPFPAIDDFRAYLEAMPDAPDADDIRDRLGRLEAQVGVGGPAPTPSSAQGVKGDDDPWKKGGVSVTAGGARKGGYDSERLDEEDDSSSLRRGSGYILAPLVGIRTWFYPSGRVSDSTVSELLGLRLGYSFNETSSIILEGAYERFNNETIDPFSVSGLSTFLGYEARLPYTKSSIDRYWLIGLGLGYEHLNITSNAIVVASASTLGGITGRGRFGTRWNLGANAGLELTLD